MTGRSVEHAQCRLFRGGNWLTTVAAIAAAELMICVTAPGPGGAETLAVHMLLPCPGSVARRSGMLRRLLDLGTQEESPEGPRRFS